MSDEVESARHFLNALRDLGPPGGTMVEFPFEALFMGIEERDRQIWNAAIRAAAAEANKHVPDDHEHWTPASWAKAECVICTTTDADGDWQFDPDVKRANEKLISEYRTLCPQLARECQRLRERVALLEREDAATREELLAFDFPDGSTSSMAAVVCRQLEAARRAAAGLQERLAELERELEIAKSWANHDR